MEPFRECVQQEAPNKLVCTEGHELGLLVVTIILPAERDCVVSEAD